MNDRLRLGLLAGVCGALLAGPSAHGYVHVVQPNDSLAELAEIAYGDAKKESIIVGANALDVHGGSPIAPGMRLEIPAPTYVRAEPGSTWASLALEYLGSTARAGVLAKANGAVPWVPPEEGREIFVFPVVSHIAGSDETSATVARKYLLDPNKSWELNLYNQRKESALKPGEVFLVPLVDLSLDPRGKRAAAAYHKLALGESMGRDYAAQRQAEPRLEDLRQADAEGRYAQVVALGNELRGAGELSKPQQVILERLLLEAYVALDETALAKRACERYAAAAGDDDPPETTLDPAYASPKVLAACRR